MKVKVSTVPPDEEKESAGSERYTRDSKRKQTESTMSDVQLHQIKPKMLRTTANNFFGTAFHSNSSPVSSSDGSPAPCESGGFKSRNQLMQSLDPIVMSFNAADFDTLAKSIRAICSKDVSLFCKLVPDAITNDCDEDIVDIDDVVFPEPPMETGEIFHHHLSGVSALLLLWMLLQETHPDAVMQIIDRRICYRQVLPVPTPPAAPATPAASVDTFSTGVAASAQSSSVKAPEAGQTAAVAVAAAFREPVPPSLATQRPVSIIEAVLKFSGSCITTHSLDALFADLSQRSGILLPSGSSSAGAMPVVSTSHTPGPPAAAVVGSAADPNTLVEYISNYLTHEAWRDAPGSASEPSSHLAAAFASAAVPGGACVTSAAAARPRPISIPTAMPAKSAEALGSLRETSRKYLADVRLVFNANDLVTRFEFNIRAAEDFAVQGV